MGSCCKVSLRTGTKLIAFLYLVPSILFCAFGIMSLSFGTDLAESGLSLGEANSTEEIGSAEEEIGSSEEEIDSTEEDDELDKLISLTEKDVVVLAGVSVIIFSALVIIVGAILTLSSVVLLVGAITRNRPLCMIWFVLQLVVVHLGAISFIKEIFAGTMSAGSIFQGFGILSVGGYFLCVVWAFMEEIRETSVWPWPYAIPKPQV